MLPESADRISRSGSTPDLDPPPDTDTSFRDDVTTRMVGLWQDLLRVRDVSASDSFFDLGGDSLAATALMAAIEDAFGCRIPMADLFEVETLESMCAAIAAEQPGRVVGVIEPLKRSGDLPPLYCVHMPAWSSYGYGTLARHMHPRRPLIAVVERVTTADGLPVSLNDTADRYARAIRDDSPGPHHLLGNSAAGVLAYEVARRLAASGDDVGFVGMIDSGYPAVRTSVVGWVR